MNRTAIRTTATRSTRPVPRKAVATGVATGVVGTGLSLTTPAAVVLAALNLVHVTHVSWWIIGGILLAPTVVGAVLFGVILAAIVTIATLDATKRPHPEH